jgi:hypothetical protein
MCAYSLDVIVKPVGNPALTGPGSALRLKNNVKTICFFKAQKLFLQNKNIVHAFT